MIQDLSNRQGKSNSQISSMAIPPWSFDSKADELMDEVFSELERIIENGGNLPTQTARLEPASSENIPENTTEIAPIDSQPSPKSSQITTIESSEIAPIDTSESELTTSEEIEVFTPILERKDNSGQYLDKILFAIIFSSLVAVIWWLANQGKLQFTFLQNLMGEPVATHEEITQSDTQFIEYMQRSLKVLDNKQQESQEEEKVAATPPGSVLPVPPNPATSEEKTTPATILQPIYIPFYPPSQIPSHSGNFSAITPPPPPTLAPSPQAAPPPAIASTPSLPPKPAPRISSPTPTAPAPVKVPTAPVEKTAKNTSTVPIQAPREVTPVVENTAEHTLNGLLEDGERSAALFNIDGTTQRVKLGGEIGVSGWTLVKVANQKALIRRNGEVRAIHPGQKF